MDEKEQRVLELARQGVLVNINGNFAIEFPEQTIKLTPVFDQDDEELIKLYERLTEAPNELAVACEQLADSIKISRGLIEALVPVLAHCLKNIAKGVVETDTRQTKIYREPPTVGEK